MIFDFSIEIPDLDIAAVTMNEETSKQINPKHIQVQRIAFVENLGWGWVNFDYYVLNDHDIDTMLDYTKQCIENYLEETDYKFLQKKHFRFLYKNQNLSFDEGYIPDFSNDTKESLESEYYLTIVDKSQSNYVVVKKVIDNTMSLRALDSLFEYDLRSCINRYADCQNIQLYCYHENIAFTDQYVELLAHTTDCCDPEKLLEQTISDLDNVPQGTDGVCKCGSFTDSEDQDYCLDKLDHNTIAADLREQKRLLEVAAYKLSSRISVEQALEYLSQDDHLEKILEIFRENAKEESE